MLIGLNSTGTNHGTLDRLVDEARRADDVGLHSMWVPNFFGMEALTCLAVVGREVPDISLGTAVVPIYTRHPFAMVQQALTTQAACTGRLTLGVGLSHRDIVEGAWGLSYERPASSMETYLSAMNALIAPGAAGASSNGAPNSAVQIEVVPVPPHVSGVTGVDVLVAALGPRMVEIAGRLADGVVLYCVGPKGIASTGPMLDASARAAGKSTPRIVASLPVSVTDDVAGARTLIAERLAAVDTLPSYRKSLDAEGVGGIADLALVGSADVIRSGLAGLAECGVTEFTAMVFGATRADSDRTLEVLGGFAQGVFA
jgi:5,10-methylenetetrahydromethanopterin reductase